MITLSSPNTTFIPSNSPSASDRKNNSVGESSLTCKAEAKMAYCVSLVPTIKNRAVGWLQFLRENSTQLVGYPDSLYQLTVRIVFDA